MKVLFVMLAVSASLTQSITTEASTPSELQVDQQAAVQTASETPVTPDRAEVGAAGEQVAMNGGYVIWYRTQYTRWHGDGPYYSYYDAFNVWKSYSDAGFEAYIGGMDG